MSKEVDLRIKELTHVLHRQLLNRSLEQVKTLTPLLISSINVYVTSKVTGKTKNCNEISFELFNIRRWSCH